MLLCTHRTCSRGGVVRISPCRDRFACASGGVHRTNKFLCAHRLRFLLAPGLTAELKGCDRKRFSSAALNKKGRKILSPGAGGRGLTAKFVVVNRAQRCDYHKLALFWWVGWAWSACRVAVAILVKSDSARNFQRPPTLPALYRQRYLNWGVRSEALQLSSIKQKREEDPFTRGGRAGSHCKVCGGTTEKINTREDTTLPKTRTSSSTPVSSTKQPRTSTATSTRKATHQTQQPRPSQHHLPMHHATGVHRNFRLQPSLQ